MIVDTQQYKVKLDIPTENFLFYEFDVAKTEHISKFIDQIKHDIPNSECLIFLFGAWHNLHEYDHWIEPLNQLQQEVSNPILVLTGLLEPGVHSQTIPKFHYHRVRIFDHISNVYYQERAEHSQILNRASQSRTKKFYWASTKDWYSRRFVLSSIIGSGLVNDGYINYKCLYSHIPSDYLHNRYRPEYHNVITQHCQAIEHLLPLPALDNTVEFEFTPLKFYQNSFLNVVTDTFFESEIFFSEKVFNAINYQQLFFYAGPANSLAYLRSLGYETFDDIIDTSYDSINDHTDRLFALSNSLVEFLKQPIETIRLAYEKSLPKIQHNKDLLQRQDAVATIKEIITKIIK